MREANQQNQSKTIAAYCEVLTNPLPLTVSTTDAFDTGTNAGVTPVNDGLPERAQALST